MQITYLGHAGFCIETRSSIIIMDPWLSREGAFDAAWFQYPQNHHLANFVQDILNKNDKDKYIYISHEHKDHFDINFLKSLQNRDFTIILADFFHPIVKNTLIKNDYRCKNIVTLKDNEPFQLQDGILVVFVLDMELDCDSAIVVKTESGTFLNLNDCKIHERLAAIGKEYGPIDIFSGQFSGAVWHPTCYKMSDEHYQIICKNKNKRKFDIIAKSLEKIKPAIYLPSAGPPCFLDPLLYPINFQEINTYPRATQLFEFLDNYEFKEQISTQWPEIMPGDTFDVAARKFTYLSPIRIKDSDFKSYLQTYAQQYIEFFNERNERNSDVNPLQVFIDLKDELINKLARMRIVHKNIPVTLYFSINEYKEEMYCIDFPHNTITTTANIEHSTDYFFISAPAWQVNKVLTHEISWADFSLTFRPTLERKPDIYNTLINGFLTLDPDSLERFCKLFHDITSKEERINIEYKGKTYSVLRYCPHQGGDLLHAAVEDCFLVCPRHQWKFDIENHGKCRYNDASIDAICLEEKKKRKGST